MARRTKLTPELQDRIYKFVQSGASIPRACEAAGISWNTVKDWMKPPLCEREPYKGFVAAMDAAKSKWAAGAEMMIVSHGKKDWRALAWMLERRRPEEYAPISRLEVTGKHEHTGRDGGPIEVAHLSDAEIDRRLKELAALRAAEDDEDH